MQGDRDPTEIGQKGLPNDTTLKGVKGFKRPVTAYWPPWSSGEPWSPSKRAAECGRTAHLKKKNNYNN